MVQDRQSFMPGIVAALIADNSFRVYCNGRVEEVKNIFVDNYARFATAVRKSSSAFELSIYKTKQARRFEWCKGDYVVNAFAQVSATPPADLGAEDLTHLIDLTYLEFDDLICREFRLLFGPSAGLSNLTIPPIGNGSPDIHTGFNEVLYYLAGAMASALITSGQRCYRTDRKRSSLFATFAAKHTLTLESAKKQGLPTGLVQKRSHGSLLYPSRLLYRVICLLEHAYSQLLTLKNVISYGGSLVKQIRDLLTKWPVFLKAFNECLEPVRKSAEEAGNDFDSRPLLLKMQEYYMRVRGKDAVKTIVGELKRKTASTNSHRGNMAAAASYSSAKRTKSAKAIQKASPGPEARRAAEVDSVFRSIELDEDYLLAMDDAADEAADEADKEVLVEGDGVEGSGDGDENGQGDGDGESDEPPIFFDLAV
jgi:hypothetical protein